MFITIDIDDEEYPVPADGQVGEELEDALVDILHDIDCVTIKTIRTVMEY